MINKTSKQTYEIISVLLPPDLHDQLRKLAYLWKMSKSKTLKTILIDFIKNSTK